MKGGERVKLETKHRNPKIKFYKSKGGKLSEKFEAVDNKFDIGGACGLELFCSCGRGALRC